MAWGQAKYCYQYDNTKSIVLTMANAFFDIEIKKKERTQHVAGLKNTIVNLP